MKRIAKIAQHVPLVTNQDPPPPQGRILKPYYYTLSFDSLKRGSLGAWLQAPVVQINVFLSPLQVLSPLQILWHKNATAKRTKNRGVFLPF